MKFKNFSTFVNETVGTVSAPVYGEAPEEFPEIAIEGDEETKKRYEKELVKVLKELYSTAMKCEYDGHKIKETLLPKYKNAKVKMKQIKLMLLN